jgi:hypothetical protein
LDSFKNQIFTKNFSNTFEVDPERLAAAGTDDKVLLEVGIEWVKRVVFNL